jgi:hypothetical protein
MVPAQDYDKPIRMPCFFGKKDFLGLKKAGAFL